MVQLSIIILSYNTKERTLTCLTSLARQYQKELEKRVFEIIVVDNASTDDTVVTINKQLSTNNKKYVKIIQNKENYGFSKGINRAAKGAGGKYFFFLNSDTVARDNGLIGMLDYMEKNRNVGILGARLENPDGSIQPSGGKFYTLTTTIAVLFGAERAGLVRFAPSQSTHIDWVSGGAMMVNASLFEALSGFDENYFMYMEDMDLCLRAKKARVQTHYYAHIAITHSQHGSSNRSFAILQIYKGLLYFFKTHKPYWQYFLIKWILRMKAAGLTAIGVMTNNIYLKNTYAKAFTLV